ncbi:BTAD domain-containing putative transcriptional regulator [Amycolatopsis umgeniensis]|uniref:DNA-binding SARP family transcriptional activator n=1 Tax=Amycolatopsis umgeniensis TaxID=336628 RepID=A0A841AN99_9PSEU|nr:AfsR/SARP family transcriptional regulator [Amycolatopsis umgeniensis]MBB5850199.1 DNA-binding SARP family transcriptional activator [Amycolatopsis umgeniensis]
MQESTVASADQPVIFRLWGKVEAVHDGELVPMGSRREQGMLAGLLAAKGLEIQRETLKAWAWDDEPESASDDLSRFMSELRKRLRKLGFADSLVNRNGLCRLGVPADSVDVNRVKALTNVEKRDDRHAAVLLAQALRLSEGKPLAGLDTRRVNSYRKELERERHALKIAYLRVELRLGRYQDHIGELSGLLDEHPDDAAVTALMMCALHFAGRDTEALEVFRRHRGYLNDELGMGASPELEGLEKCLLNNDLTADGRAYALGRPYLANGDSPMSPTEPLLVAIRPDAGSPEEVRRVAFESFGAGSFQARQAEDCLLCVVSPDVAPVEVMGVWMDRLVLGMPHRAQVGIGMGNEVEVCDLARSAYARSVLNCAPDSNLVVAVSNELYELTSSLPELQIDSSSYRKDDRGVAGWVRVPGLSVPPRPRPDGPTEDVRMVSSASSGPNVAFNGKTKIRTQVVASTVENIK